MDNKYNQDKVKKSVELFLEGIGEEISGPNVIETPDRVAKMWGILLGGYDKDPKDCLKTFPTTSSDMVTLTNVPFYSLCSHHLLPFVGKIHFAYLPDGKVVGISKLIRFARICAKRLNLQEDLTQNIADLLMEYLGARGVIVRIEASHFCMTFRGVRSQGAVMVTTAKRGLFNEKSELVTEFNLALRDTNNFAY